MMNRSLFLRLCKTLLAVCSFAGVPCVSSAQVVASAPTPAIDAASFGAPAEKLKIAGVPNAGKVSDVLFRGAQPSSQGLTELKKLGINTIVDLRGNPGPVTREREQAESLGMHFIDIPVKGWSGPSNAQVAEFLKLLQQNPTQKFFVHCYYGSDRTGVMVAAYRMTQQNWTPDQAIAEMDSFGFHYYLYPAMKSYVRRFPITFGADNTFAPLHPASSAPR